LYIVSKLMGQRPTQHFISFHFIVFTYTDAHAPTSSHITTCVRLTSQVARSCARKQPGGGATASTQQLLQRGQYRESQHQLQRLTPLGGKFAK
jgi:hypothetical protein